MFLRKGLSLLILFVFSSLLLFATKQDKEVVYPLNEPIKTVITGVYPDSMKNIHIWVTDYSHYIDWLNIPPTVIPTVNGEFRFQTYLKNPVYISIEYWGVSLQRIFNGRASKRHFTIGLLVEPGDSLFVDERIFTYGYENMKVSGKGAEKIWCEQAIQKNTNLFDFPFGVGGKPLENRIGLTDSISNMVLRTLDIYKHRISEAAYSIIKMNYIGMLSPSVSEIIVKSKWNINEPLVQKLFLEGLNRFSHRVDLADPNLAYTLYNSETFSVIVPIFLLDALQSKKNYNQYGSFSKERYMALIRFLPTGRYKERVIANYLIKCIQKEPMTTQLKECIVDFLHKKDTSAPLYGGVQQVYKTYTLKLAKGAEAFKFSLPDTTGRIHKLEDYRGKIILIDFMFTGCIGCAGMVKDLKKVEQNFGDNKDVVFISVSVDKKLDWRRIPNVEYFVPGSIFLYTNNKGDDHPLIKHYQLRSYPSLVLVDKKGKLISANAPRPDADGGRALTKMINEALSNN